METLDRLMSVVIRDAWEWRRRNVIQGVSRIKGVTIVIERKGGHARSYEYSPRGLKIAVR
jgi:hypothetical protein